jgi:hypothetical protein
VLGSKGKAYTTVGSMESCGWPVVALLRRFVALVDVERAIPAMDAQD